MVGLWLKSGLLACLSHFIILHMLVPISINTMYGMMKLLCSLHAGWSQLLMLTLSTLKITQTLSQLPVCHVDHENLMISVTLKDCVIFSIQAC